jgi:hypothetical protein
MHHSLPHHVIWLRLAAPLLVTLVICMPEMAMAQASPFLTGASSLQTNILILRCSASEGGGTARFASQLIGEREVLRTTVSTSRRANERWESVSRSEHFAVEAAILPSQVEQLPDLAGYLKYASDPTWQRVRLDAKSAWNELKSTSIEPGAARQQPSLDLNHE